jgi:ketosteroid isomerase-like protein
MTPLVALVAGGSLAACGALSACGAQNAGVHDGTPQTPAGGADRDAGTAAAEGDDDEGNGTSAAGGGGSEEKEVETIKAFFAAQNAHDEDAIADLYTKDARVSTPGTPDWIGPDMIRDEEKELFAAVSDGKWGVRRILVKEKVAIVEWTATGTVPPEIRKSGPARRFGVNGVSIMWFGADGLIKEEHDMMNSPTLNAQAGPQKGKVRDVQLMPSGTPDVRIASGTPEEGKNVDLVKALNRAYETRDERSFADLLTEDIMWDDYTSPAALTGRTDVSRVFGMLVTALPDIKLTCKAWGIDDVVAQECTRNATHEGLLPLGSIKVPPTHAHTTTRFVDVLVVRRGKIGKLARYADNLDMVEQLGIAKPDRKK